VPGLASRSPTPFVSGLSVIHGASGPRLLAFGPFGAIGSVISKGIAQWDGLEWSAISAEPNSLVTCAAIFEVEGLPTLHIAGSFTTVAGEAALRVARQTERGWEALAGGTDATVRALAVGAVGGDQPALFAGGSFQHAGGIAAPSIARWDGTEWAALGAGLNGTVRLLAVAALGGEVGSSLYAAGSFTASGEVPTAHVARWDGVQWSPLEAGVDGPVWSALVADVGEGLSLYIAGEFSHAGGIPSPGIARWDGHRWHPMGGAMPPGNIRLAVVDLGQGPRLFAADTWAAIPGEPSAGVLAEWTGGVWSTVATLAGSVFDLVGWEHPAGAALILAGGSATQVNGAASPGLSRYDGATWTTPAPNSGIVGDLFVYAAHRRKEGTQNVLYFAGGIAGPNARAAVLRWDGSTAAELGVLPPGYVSDLLEHDDGSGSLLYAVGQFKDLARGVTFGVARWTGHSWDFMESTIPACLACDVFAATVFDDGSGPALCVGGRFLSIGGVSALNVARLRNGLWEPLGAGVPGSVYSIHVHEGEDGPMLVAGGELFWPSSQVGVVAWDGVGWNSLAGADDAEAVTEGAVLAMVTFDDGSGPALYAGLHAGGGACVRRWQGERWSTLGPTLYGSIHALAVHDDGSGAALHAGGQCMVLGGTGPSPQQIARWNGATWQAVGFGLGPVDQTGLGSGVTELLSVPGLGLVAAGQFRDALDGPAIGVAADSVAVWGPGGAPRVSVQPQQRTIRAGDALALAVGVFSKPASGALEYQWRRDGAPLQDGGAVSGATTSVLTIAPAEQDAAGIYDVLVGNHCGDDFSDPALVTVNCRSDLDADGVVDAADLGVLLAGWDGAWPELDLSGDGLVGAEDLAILIDEWGCRSSP